MIFSLSNSKEVRRNKSFSQYDASSKYRRSIKIEHPHLKDDSPINYITSNNNNSNNNNTIKQNGHTKSTLDEINKNSIANSEWTIWI